MPNNNNFLLVILICIILFWIININTQTNNKNNLERFGKTESPLLSETSIVENSTRTTSTVSTKSIESNSPSLENRQFSNNVKFNSEQDLLIKPPNNQEPTKLNSSYQSMADQFVNNSKQEMYSNLSSAPNKQDELLNVNDSYMLLPSNNIPDAKFNKVMSKEQKRPVLSSGDLLPKDENKDWFQVPNSKFNLMQAIDLEIPEIKIGIDTVGQSRKNATYDLRAAPPNPKFVVSPWSNSTIEPDYNTKPLC